MNPTRLQRALKLLRAWWLQDVSPEERVLLPAMLAILLLWWMER